MIDTHEFRNGMAMLTGAVNVITTAGADGLAGFTATAVCSVTDQPPMLLVCMNRSSYAHRFFTAMAWSTGMKATRSGEVISSSPCAFKVALWLP